MSDNDRLYFDYNATTPIAPEVAAAIAEYFPADGQPVLCRGTASHGNPSSGHWAGAPAKAAIERAREQVAELLGAKPSEVIFTSGGTEANNFAIKGSFFKHGPPCHIVTSVMEHPATVAPCRFLERLGATVTLVGVDSDGRVLPEAIADAIRPDTRLITLMHANNETGVLQPIAAVGKLARSRGVLLHVDAAQSVGKVPVRMDDLGCDLLSIAGHKLYAPKGIGALIARTGVELAPLIHGAGHEAGRRAGTENTPYIVGLGVACQLAQRWLAQNQLAGVRDYLWNSLRERFGDAIVLFGHPTERLPNTLFVGCRGRSGPELLAQLDGVAASTGSACHTGSGRMAAVLEAMGVAPELGRGAIRFSLGRESTRADVDALIGRLSRTLTR